MRALNSELGLSHGTINQRFGTKENLYVEAIDHGFAGLLADVNALLRSEEMPQDPLEELRVRFRAFLLASARRPHLNRLINNEGVVPSPVLDHIFESYIVPAMKPTRRLINKLAKLGVIEPQTDRAILFLLANGAGSAFSLPGLASKFDRLDGAVRTEAYCDEMATFMVNGLRKPAGSVRRQPARRPARSARA